MQQTQPLIFFALAIAATFVTVRLGVQAPGIAGIPAALGLAVRGGMLAFFAWVLS